MASEIFKDTKDRAWSLGLTFGDLKRVINDTGINLAKPGRPVTEDKLLDMKEEEYPVYLRLAFDPVLLIDVIFALLQPQATEKGVSAEEFGNSIDAEVFGDLSEKFWKVYHGFFTGAQDPVHANMIAGILKARQMQNKNAVRMGEVVNRMVERQEKELDQKLSEVEKETTLSSAMNSPAM